MRPEEARHPDDVSHTQLVTGDLDKDCMSRFRTLINDILTIQMSQLDWTCPHARTTEDDWLGLAQPRQLLSLCGTGWQLPHFVHLHGAGSLPA